MTVERIPIENREQWLDMRRECVTASDVASVCGVGRRTPLAIFADKKRLIPAVEDNAPMRRGRWMESAVFEALKESFPKWKIERGKIFMIDRAARLGATPDGVALPNDNRGLGIVQAKVVSRPIFRRDWVGDEYATNDEHAPATVPLDYQLQTLTETMLAGFTWGCVAALVLDTYTAFLRVLDVPRHLPAEDMIRAKTLAFWADVEANRFPDVVPRKDGDTLAAIYPDDDGPDVDLTGDNRALELVTIREEMKRVAKVAAEDADAAETELKAKLGAARYGRLADGRRISWALTHRDGHYVDDSDYRQFRILKR